jgi:hypothetical protein
MDSQVMTNPQIRPHLLWEYDLSNFDYTSSAQVVIERVIEHGTIPEWREILRFYGRARVLEAAEWSRQLDARDKYFTTVIVDSDLVA